MQIFLFSASFAIDTSILRFGSINRTLGGASDGADVRGLCAKDHALLRGGQQFVASST
jgi:hypothetical protein